MKKRPNKIKLLLIIGIFIITNLKFGQVLALGELTEFIISPSIEQTEFVTYGYEDINWDASSKQKKVFDVWVGQGKPIDENGWAYITVNNEKRYFIALATAFGEVGDYIDLRVEDGLGEKLVTCIKAEAKSINDEVNDLNDGAYITGGDHIGHKYGTKCNILEIQIKDDSYKSKMTDSFLRSLVPVKRILVRGNYFEHPDGPLDTTSSRTIGSGYSENTRRTTKKKSDDDSSITNVLGNILAEIVDSIATSIENLITGGDETSVLVAKVDEGSDDASTGSGASPAVPAVGDADIMRTCEQLTRYLMNKNVNYGYGTNNNIDENYNNPDYQIDCASYVAIVLWKSGKLSKDKINRHGYLAANDIAEMAAAERWQKLNANDKLIEGDILVKTDKHVAIYAGDGKVWDEYTAVIEKDEKTGKKTVPTGAPYPPVGGFTQFDVRYRPPQ